MSEQEIIKNYPGSTDQGNAEINGDGSFVSGDVGGATATGPDRET
jgi:hypothetical protein